LAWNFGMLIGVCAVERTNMASNQVAGVMPSSGDYEKLGSFFLGREVDASSGKSLDGSPLLMLDSRDLVTHAVCLGMTGSGKTGLCISLLEEAAINGIPAIIIDPKGDLSNLLLTFPDLSPASFAPWVNEDDARRAGMDGASYAAKQASAWSEGLKQWGQDGARIARLKDAAECVIYTPGSSAGRQVAILKSLSVPSRAICGDAEMFREAVSSTASSLLGLVGVKADPMRSKEHILLCNIIYLAWAGGKSLELGGLIQQIQQPPFSRVGAMELESFYPAKERFELAMGINNLLASPGFAAWTQGEPLDVGKMMRSPAGKPRLAIFSIAHLDDAQRMFFVSMLLSEVLGWVRMQPGTTSLRALLYMDEIAGYMPPTSNPPSKGPLLTLMKQARAFGLGVVLATQNPVDLDYKALSNAGTWFLGRLQTEQDKARVLDGLDAASSAAGQSFDRAEADELLSKLPKRCFILKSVHRSATSVFATRWCLSYLRGPLTREQIRHLTHGAGALTGSGSVTAGANPFGAVADGDGGGLPFMPEGMGMGASVAGAMSQPAASARSMQMPILAPQIPQFCVKPVMAAPAGSEIVYRPGLVGLAMVWFTSKPLGIDEQREVCELCPITDGAVPVDWERAEQVEIHEDQLVRQPSIAGRFADLPAIAGEARSYTGWSKGFVDSIVRNAKIELWHAPTLKLVGKPGESEAEFRGRVDVLLRERRDAQLDKLKAKFAPKVQALDEKLRRAQQAIEVQQSQAKNAQFGTLLSAGAAVLGGLFGKKVISAGNVGKVATAARSAGRAASEAGDVGRAKENYASLQQQMAELEASFKEEVAKISQAIADSAPVQKTTVTARKTGIQVRSVVLAWLPEAVDNQGGVTLLWHAAPAMHEKAGMR
jgi:hypothetical protein